ITSSRGPQVLRSSLAVSLAFASRDGFTSFACMLADRSMRNTHRFSSGGVVRPMGSATANAAMRISRICRRRRRLDLSFWNGALTRMSWIDRVQSHVLETATFFLFSLRKYMRTTGTAAAAQKRAQGLRKLIPAPLGENQNENEKRTPRPPRGGAGAKA